MRRKKIAIKLSEVSSKRREISRRKEKKGKTKEIETKQKRERERKKGII